MWAVGRRRLTVRLGLGRGAARPRRGRSDRGGDGPTEEGTVRPHVAERCSGARPRAVQGPEREEDSERFGEPAQEPRAQVNGSRVSGLSVRAAQRSDSPRPGASSVHAAPGEATGIPPCGSSRGTGPPAHVQHLPVPTALQAAALG